MGFGAQLKFLRAIAGLTQHELADVSGVARAQIARYESGAGEPSWSVAVALAKALDADVGEFVDRPAAEPAKRRPKKKSVASRIKRRMGPRFSRDRGGDVG